MIMKIDEDEEIDRIEFTMSLKLFLWEQSKFSISL